MENLNSNSSIKSVKHCFNFRVKLLIVLLILIIVLVSLIILKFSALAYYISPIIKHRRDAKLHEFPFAVFAEWNCGGTVIDENWIVTSAHCCSKKYTSVIADVIHKNDDERKGQKRKVLKIFKNPKADIGLYYVKPFKFIGNFEPALLPPKNFEYPKEVIIAAWGHRTINSTHIYAQTLQTTVLQIEDNPQAPLKQFRSINSKQAGTCYEGSGFGVFVKNKNNRYMLIGINSDLNGGFCNKLGTKSYFEKIPYYLDWINGVRFNFTISQMNHVDDKI